MRKVKISALGCYVPERVLTNDDLEKMVETTNQWILERTGIAERHIADAGTATSDLAVAAARQALDQRGIDACGVGCHSGMHRDTGHVLPFDRLPGAKPNWAPRAPGGSI